MAATDRLVTALDSASGPLEPLVYTVDQAARLLGISRSHAYDLIARGEFPVATRQLGRRRLIPRAALDRYLAGEPSP